MEKWDAYTRDGIRTEVELVRGEPIPEGLYHLACEVLVRHVDGSYLCMKRSMLKPNYPGYYEATAGGSALKGVYSIALSVMWIATRIQLRYRKAKQRVING